MAIHVECLIMAIRLCDSLRRTQYRVLEDEYGGLGAYLYVSTVNSLLDFEVTREKKV